MDKEKLKLGLDHKRQDDAVFKFFKEAMEDIGTVFAMDTEKRNYTSERVQLVSVFTFLDVVASYWYEYLGKTGTQKERFLTFTKQYCLTTKNPDYSNGDFVNLTPENLYAFRSSMVHFFGIAGLDNDYKITVAANRISDDLIEKWRQGFRERGHEVLIIKPKKLYNLILEGTLLILDEWKKIINEAQADDNKKWSHIEGINRIYKKIHSEGAVKVSHQQ